MPYLIKSFRYVQKNRTCFVIFFEVFVNGGSDGKKLIDCRVTRSKTRLIFREQIVNIQKCINLVEYNFL